MHRFRLAAMAGAVALLACAQGARAQATARIVVPFASGGGQDVLARVLAPELGSSLGQVFIVDNRAGAGGAVGASVVARSKPDGSALLMAASSHIITAMLDSKTPYDPIKDFTAVAYVGTGSYILLVNANLRVNNVAS